MLRCANQPEIKLRSHGLYLQEYFYVNKSFLACSFKFSVFANQEESALRCSYRTMAAEENLIMVRLNLCSSYTILYYHPFTRNYY